MGDEFYCVIKLVSGEEILSLIMVDQNDDDPIIILQNPVTIKIVHNNQGSGVKIKPWMELTEDNIFFIKLDKVITMTETKDVKLIQLYEHYVHDDSIDVYVPGGKVGVSTEMGYISSVEDARSKLERLYKGLKET